MSRPLPTIAPEELLCTTESCHVRGSYRMLAIWAAGLVGGVVVSNSGHYYLAVMLGGLAILAGVVLYTRLDTQFAPPRPLPVLDGAVGDGPWPELAPVGTGRDQEEAALPAAELRGIGAPR